MIPLARLRRWALWSAAAWALGGLAHPGIAPWAALLWMGLGCAALRRHGRAARRQRPILYRLFFAWGGAVLLWSAFARLPFTNGITARAAAFLGVSCLCAAVMERLLALSVPGRMCRLLAAAEILAAAALYRL